MSVLYCDPALSPGVCGDEVCEVSFATHPDAFDVVNLPTPGERGGLGCSTGLFGATEGPPDGRIGAEVTLAALAFTTRRLEPQIDGGYVVRFSPASGTPAGGFSADVEMEWEAHGRRGAAVATAPVDDAEDVNYARSTPEVFVEAIRREFRDETLVEETAPHRNFLNNGVVSDGEGYKGLGQDGLNPFAEPEALPDRTTTFEERFPFEDDLTYGFYKRLRVVADLETNAGAAFVSSDVSESNEDGGQGFEHDKWFLEPQTLRITSLDGMTFAGC